MRAWMQILGVLLIGVMLMGQTPTPEDPLAIIRDISMVAVGTGADITVKTKFVGYQNQKIEICTMIKGVPDASAPTLAQSCSVVTPTSNSALMSNTFSFPASKLPYGLWFVCVEVRLKSSGELLTTKIEGIKPWRGRRPRSGY